MTGPAELVHVVRNGLVESVHTGDVAVCDADGRLRAFAGDPERMLFGRSCEKPLQGAVSFFAMDEPDLPDDEVAVMCASHSGEPVHIAAVRRLLRRGPVPRRRAPDAARPRDQGRAVAHLGRLLGEPRRPARGVRSPRVGSGHLPGAEPSDPSPGAPGGHGRDRRRAAEDRRGRLRDPGPRGSAPGDGHDVRPARQSRAAGTARFGGRPDRPRDARRPAHGGGHAAPGHRRDDGGRRAGDREGGGRGARVRDLAVPGASGSRSRSPTGTGGVSPPPFVKVLRDLDVFPEADPEELRPHERLPVLGGEEPQGAVEAVVRLRSAR